jgi:DNA-binding CsgD family transcriptional regulator/PAS domain-containing protein
MASGDLYVQAVESIYACGTGEGLISDALSVTSRLLGATGATYEVIDKTSGLKWFCSAGIPAAASKQYSDHFAAENPRIKPTLRQNAGEVIWDYKLLDEATMKRDAFYSEFLPSMGLRYFIGAVLEQTPDRIAVVSVQRSRQKGHAERREIALMHRLCPHFQRAYSMRKLVGVNTPSLFESALDLLADGIALLRRDGRILHVNEALRSIAATSRDFRICRDSVEFATPELRGRFASALGAAQRVREPNAAYLATDFAVPREGLPPYTISVRPLLHGGGEPTHPEAAAMLMVHDPLQQNRAAGGMLQELYGLTNAEAQLVQALGGGMTAVAYAQSRNISVTTVYTHLRRTREKTGWKSVAELTRRFHEVNVALRA